MTSAGEGLHKHRLLGLDNKFVQKKSLKAHNGHYILQTILAQVTGLLERVGDAEVQM